MRVGGRDAGAIELRGRERQLVALARRAELPRALHVEAVALAPGAGERAVDVDVDAEIGALGAELVGRDHVIDQRLDERRLVEIEELIPAASGRPARSRLLRLRGLRGAAVVRRRLRRRPRRRFSENRADQILVFVIASPPCLRRPKRGPLGHAFDAKHAAFELVRQDEVWPVIALHRIGR